MISDSNNRRHLFRIAGGTAIVALLLLAGGAGAATEIDACGTISSAGDYVLNASVTNSGLSSCINITSSDVILDGAGYTIDGTDASNTYGVYVFNSTTALTNVTVKNLKLMDWNKGIYYNNVGNGSVTNNTVNSSAVGIYLQTSSNNTLINNTAISNTNTGIYLISSSNNNTLTNNNASSNTNGYGITLQTSSNNTLTNNTASSNTNGYGIYIISSSNNTLNNNTASSNAFGIYLISSSSNSTLTNNTASSNSNTGIYLSTSGYSTLANNSMTGNGYNFALFGGTYSDFNNTIYTNNTVDGKPILYIKSVSDTIYDSSSNAGVFYCIFCNNVTIKDLTFTKNGFGVFFWGTNNSKIENINANSNSQDGISLYSSSNNNTLINNIVNSNGNAAGIYISFSNNNTLTNNTANSNFFGIYIDSSSNNTLTNNTANSNVQWGTYLSSSSNNTLTNNNVSSNTQYGIYLESSSNSNTLNNNTANSNGYAGVLLQSSSSNNTLTRNTANSNSYGIFLDSSNSNNLTNNTANSNNGVNLVGTASYSSTGVYLYSSSNNNLTNNTASSNNYGILLESSSSSNTITSNTANSNTQNGIRLESSSNSNTLTNNTASSNSANANSAGIYLFDSNNNIVEGGVLNFNSYGIYTEESSSVSGNIYRRNTITNTTSDGIYLYETSSGIYDMTIEDNTITNTTSNGIYLYENFGGIYNIDIKNNTIITSSNGVNLEQTSSDIYNVTIKNNTIKNSSSYGLYLNNVGFTTPYNNITNNHFNNTNNVSVVGGGTNIWNTTQTAGMNIVGGLYLGGNFWANLSGTGFSQTCTDATPNDGICDSSFTIDINNIDYLPLSVSVSSGAAPSFVTANPIRALTRSGAATRVPTNVSFYYNGSIIRINASLNQSGLTVSGNFANVDNASSISTSTSYQNASGEYIYTLTATAGNVGVGVQSVTITATNASTGASNSSVFIALMNINPLVFEPTLGGTNWTEIDDFTNATLTFEKFEDVTHAVSEGKLEFLDPMNLADNTTGTALQNLGTNLQMAQDSMNLNSAANALAAMNVSSRLTMYNLTNFTNSPGILQDGTPIVMAGQTSGGAVSSLTWYPNSTLVFQVSHWTNYSADGQPPAMTLESPTPAGGSTNTTGNVTIQVSLNENGSARLNWQGVNETMTGIAPDTNKNFRINKTGLLSGNYTFKVYTNDSVGNTNVTETRTTTVNRSTITDISGSINTTNATVTAQIIITAPDTNVTVDIPVGTVARNASGDALTNITIDSLAEVNSSAQSAATSASLSFLGKNLSLGPDGATFSPPIQIQFNYADEDLEAAGVSESNLVVRWYNSTSGAWETLTTYRHNTTANYIIANASHFSTFALLGTVTSTPATSTGSSGSTGGSGVTTSEPFDNILKAERYDRNLIANTSVAYIFKEPEHAIYEIAVINSISENDVALRCEALKGTSKLVTAPPPGAVYLNENVWLGTKRIKEAAIKFRVTNSWLNENNLAGSEVKMVKWDGSKWVQLETAEKTKDATFTYYEAKTDTFSQFAITGLKGEVVPTATPAIEVTETPAITATPAIASTEKAAGFELVLATVSFLAVYLFVRKRI